MDGLKENSRKWQKLILVANIVVAAIITLVEIGVSVMMYFENLIMQDMRTYITRFFLVPNLVIWTIVIINIIVFLFLKRYKDDVDFNAKYAHALDYGCGSLYDDIINMTQMVTLTVICGVAAYIHYVFNAIIAIFCIPVLLSIVFYSVKICARTLFLSEIGMLISAVHKYMERSLIETLIIPNSVIAMILIGVAGMMAIRLVKQMRAQNEQLIEAREEAIVANKAKSNFLANMSHEIRTPINAVLGMNEMILKETKEENISSYAIDIKQAANSLLNIINDILDVSKVESGKMEIRPVEYGISSLIYDSYSTVALRAKEKNLKLEMDVNDQIPCKLLGDDIRLKQIIVNLLTNAVKYTSSGSVTITFDGEYYNNFYKLKVAVKDTGMGIKEEDLPKLTEQFQRFEEDKNRNIEGTGLGMNITLHLLELMDSKLIVKSEYGKGSCFSFEVVQGIVDMTPVGNIEQRLKRDMNKNTSQERESWIAPTAKILVVDDNEMNLKVFSNLLKNTMMQIDQATSGKMCLEMVAQTRYDIIFMDHMMPEMDGIETFNWMKKMGEYPCKDTPVVILTANAVVGAKEMYLKEGFAEYLSKPIILEKLEEVIKRFLPDGMVEESDHQRVPAKTEINLPEIDGMNWQYAMLTLKDEAMVLDFVNVFYGNLAENRRILQEMLQNLEEEEILTQFRIRVHSLKSTAATVGALSLSEIARLCEYAARDKKLDQVRNLWQYLNESIEKYEEALKVFAPEQEEKQECKDYEKLRVQLEILKGHILNMKMDEADEIMQDIQKFCYSEKIQKLVDKLLVAETNFDETAVFEIGEQITNAINEGEMK